MKITKITESAHPIGGIIVYHDGPDSPYHLHDGYNTARASKIREAVKSYEGDIISSSELLESRKEQESKAAQKRLDLAEANREKSLAKEEAKVSQLISAGFDDAQAKAIVEIMK